MEFPNLSEPQEEGRLKGLDLLLLISRGKMHKSSLSSFIGVRPAAAYSELITLFGKAPLRIHDSSSFRAHKSAFQEVIELPWDRLSLD